MVLSGISVILLGLILYESLSLKIEKSPGSSVGRGQLAY